MSEKINADFSVEQWLSYFEGIHPAKIELTLDRMRTVAEHLSLLTVPGRIVTVTGTNGKGSVTGLLSRILQRAGYTVNLYNSPHLIRFNERITVHGRNISDELLLEAFGKIEQVRRDTGISLTFFEITTLAAFYAFIKNPADFVILEVGMGGRYDSTNLLDAELAVAQPARRSAIRRPVFSNPVPNLSTVRRIFRTVWRSGPVRCRVNCSVSAGTTVSL